MAIARHNHRLGILSGILDLGECLGTGDGAKGQSAAIASVNYNRGKVESFLERLQIERQLHKVVGAGQTAKTVLSALDDAEPVIPEGLPVMNSEWIVLARVGYWRMAHDRLVGAYADLVR